MVFSTEGGDEVFASCRRCRPMLAERWTRGLPRPGTRGFRSRGRQGRWRLKDWPRPLLPPGYPERPKRGFHVLVCDWLKGERVAHLGQRLPANRGVRRRLDTCRIPELVAAGQEGRGVDRELLGLLQFALWHRLFVGQPWLRRAPDKDPFDRVLCEA